MGGQSNVPSGGKREGAGRRKPKVDDGTLASPGFATSVLARIGEGCPKVIKTAEDYQLSLLYEADLQTRSVNFNRLLDRKYGKPPQSIINRDTRENARDVDFGDLPMPR